MKKGTKHSEETRKKISSIIKKSMDKEKLLKTAFKKGHTPWNKELKGIRLSRKSEFQIGQFVGNEHPSWKGGIQTPINDCVYLWNGANKRIRRPRKLYEQHYGKIRKGFVIWHIDGNRYNDSIENLEAISRAEMMKRNFTKRWME